MMRISSVLTAAALVLADGRSAAAHIELTAPLARGEAQKTGPCGAPNGSRSDNVCQFRPGATIVVTWNETIDHPGHFRISFDDDGSDDFADPAGFDDVSGGPTVLVDGVPDRNVAGGDASYSQEVVLPDVECDGCTLQLIQVMGDKPPYGDGNDIYYQCADLILSPAAPADPAEACTSGGGGDGDQAGEASGCSAATTDGGTWAILLTAALHRFRRGRRAKLASARAAG